MHAGFGNGRLGRRLPLRAEVVYMRLGSGPPNQHLTGKPGQLTGALATARIGSGLLECGTFLE